MEIKSLNVSGLTDIKDEAAEVLTGGQFTVNFITEDGERIKNTVTSGSGTFDIPDNIDRIRVRNRSGESLNFVADFTNGTSINSGDTFSLESKSGTTVFNAGDTSRSLDTGRPFTPTQITVSGN